MEVINVYVHSDGLDDTAMKVSCLPNDSPIFSPMHSEIDITIPYFNRQSYVELNPLDPIQSIDIIFTTERRHGLIFYWEKKSRGFYWIISIRNKILELV